MSPQTTRQTRPYADLCEHTHQPTHTHAPTNIQTPLYPALAPPHPPPTSPAHRLRMHTGPLTPKYRSLSNCSHTSPSPSPSPDPSSSSSLRSVWIGAPPPPPQRQWHLLFMA